MINENIKKMRLKKGLSQIELAKLLHVSQNTVSSWETGRTEPNLGIIENLSRIFHCQKSDLLDFQDFENDRKDFFLKISIDTSGDASASFVDLEISKEEEIFLNAFRESDDVTKKAIKRLLASYIALRKEKE